MKLEHLGEVIDIDPRQAALEAAILRHLAKHGPTRQSTLFHRVAARNYGAKSQRHPLFLQAIERLVEKALVIRAVLSRASFLLRLPEKSQ